MIFALIDKQSKTVVNTISWDGDTSKWQPPTEFDFIRIDNLDIGVGIGWTYLDGKWIEPVPIISPALEQPTTSGTQEL